MLYTDSVLVNSPGLYFPFNNGATNYGSSSGSVTFNTAATYMKTALAGGDEYCLSLGDMSITSLVSSLSPSTTHVSELVMFPLDIGCKATLLQFYGTVSDIDGDFTAGSPMTLSYDDGIFVIDINGIKYKSSRLMAMQPTHVVLSLMVSRLTLIVDGNIEIDTNVTFPRNTVTTVNSVITTGTMYVSHYSFYGYFSQTERYSNNAAFIGSQPTYSTNSSYDLTKSLARNSIVYGNYWPVVSSQNVEQTNGVGINATSVVSIVNAGVSFSSNTCKLYGAISLPKYDRYYLSSLSTDIVCTFYDGGTAKQTLIYIGNGTDYVTVYKQSTALFIEAQVGTDFLVQQCGTVSNGTQYTLDFTVEQNQATFVQGATTATIPFSVLPCLINNTLIGADINNENVMAGAVVSIDVVENSVTVLDVTFTGDKFNVVQNGTATLQMPVADTDYVCVEYSPHASDVAIAGVKNGQIVAAADLVANFQSTDNEESVIKNLSLTAVDVASSKLKLGKDLYLNNPLNQRIVSHNGVAGVHLVDQYMTYEPDTTTDNIIPDANMDQGRWTVTSGSATVIKDPTAVDGTAVEVIPSGATTIKSEIFSVEVSTAYVAELIAKSESSVAGTLQIEWFTSAGVSISTSTASVTVSPLWETLTVSATSPSTARYAQVSLIMASTTSRTCFAYALFGIDPAYTVIQSNRSIRAIDMQFSRLTDATANAYAYLVSFYDGVHRYIRITQSNNYITYSGFDQVYVNGVAVASGVAIKPYYNSTLYARVAPTYTNANTKIIPSTTKKLYIGSLYSLSHTGSLAISYVDFLAEPRTDPAYLYKVKRGIPTSQTMTDTLTSTASENYTVLNAPSVIYSIAN